MYHLTLQITILGIAPDKPIMCLQENLVDCADCGGLSRLEKIFFARVKNYNSVIPSIHIQSMRKVAESVKYWWQ